MSIIFSKIEHDYSVKQPVEVVRQSSGIISLTTTTTTTSSVGQQQQLIAVSGAVQQQQQQQPQQQQQQQQQAAPVNDENAIPSALHVDMPSVCFPLIIL